MNDKLFSIREAITVGWQKTIANLWSFFLVLLASWVVSAIVNDFSKGSGRRYFLSSLVSLLGWALLALIQMGFLRMVLKILDGGKAGMKELPSSFPQFLRFFAATILCGIMVAIGFCLLIIPGIILIVRLQFYQYIILETDLGPVQALKRSWQITRGHSWKLFLMLFLLFAIVLLGAILIGVGLLVAIPLAAIAAAFVYRKLSAVIPLSIPPVVAAEPVPVA